MADLRGDGMQTGEAHAQPAESALVRTSAEDEQVSGLIRRVRRMAKLSQRQLAHELGVSQSAVAKWETGRTSPTARMLAGILRVVDLGLAAVREPVEGACVEPAQTVGGAGELVPPMAATAARDAVGRRYPAHTFVWAEGWWAPEGSETTAWFDQFRWRSEVLELPRVRYSRRWQLGRRPTVHDLHEHPTWEQLVAEARASWAPPRRNILSIPEWALQDSRKSRNRRPEEFRALARVVSVARASPVDRGRTLVPRPTRE
ncbi:MAG: transcriptional regulator, family [Nocardioides sp.]|nr:transcriptional regulator, family [Nocardioides sp.]